MIDTEVKSIAEHIKQLRLIMNFTPEEMARDTSVSLEEYLDCEEGKKDMTFSFLHKCAVKFGIDMSELVSGYMPTLTKYNLTRAGKGMSIKRRGSFDYQHVAPYLKNRLCDPALVIAKYNPQLQHEPIMLTTHHGQEFDYVLSGRLKVEIDGRTEILEAGDSILLNSTYPHGMIAIDGKDSQFITVVINGNDTLSNDVTYLPDTIEPTSNKLVYQNFVDETLNSDGSLENISFHYPDNFNFAYDVIDEIAAKTPHKRALLWLSKNKERKDISFADVSAYSAKAANYLSTLGVKRGDRVMLILKRHYQYWFIVNALHRIGAIAIPATNQLTAKDIDYRIKAAGVSAIVCTVDGEVAQHVDAAAQNCPTLKTKISVNGELAGWRWFDKEVEAFNNYYPRPAEQKASDPMLMYFTSGTSGYPKIATHSYTYPLGHIVTARYWQNVDPNGLHLTISDTGWAKAGWGKIYGQWLCETGLFVYDFDKFEAADILPLFREYNITTFCAPPTMYRFFIKEDLGKYDLSSLKHAATAGEALNAEVFDQFMKHTGLKIMEGFGQTESTALIANFIGMTPKHGSMGKPSPQYPVTLINSEGQPCKDGEAGEIVLIKQDKLPCGIFIGYYTEENGISDPWSSGYYHTGDMAWRDEEGYYWYVGRIDDLIKSSGYRIGPFEIESVLMELPYILECAITGVPDEIRGQVVKATIRLTNNTQGTEELKKEIQNYVKERTAPYKYPRIVEFVDELPKTFSGKIRRREIRDNHKQDNQ